MNWQQALAEIESIEFDVQLNVVSSFDLFLNAARDEPAVIALYEAMQASEEVSDTVLERVSKLSTQEIDTRYGNTNDAALTVYLWLLSLCRKAHATAGALCIVGAPNCFYAWKAARLVLLPSLAPMPAGDMVSGRNSNGVETPLNGSGGWACRPHLLCYGIRPFFTGSVTPLSMAGSAGHV